MKEAQFERTALLHLARRADKDAKGVGVGAGGMVRTKTERGRRAWDLQHRKLLIPFLLGLR